MFRFWLCLGGRRVFDLVDSFQLQFDGKNPINDENSILT